MSEKLKRIEIPIGLAAALKQRYRPHVRKALQQGISGIESAVLWAYLQGVCDGAEVQARTGVLPEGE